MSLVTEIADAVVAELAQVSGITAVRTWRRYVDATALPTPIVYVVPRSETIERFTRTAQRFDVVIESNLLVKVAPDDMDSGADEADALADGIVAKLSSAMSLSLPSATAKRIALAREPVSSDAHLRDHGVFSTVILATYSVAITET